MMRWDCKDIDRDAVILELMLEAGLTDAPEVTDSLKALESFASMPAPVPGRARGDVGWLGCGETLPSTSSASGVSCASIAPPLLVLRS
ncbi:hypothetical protein AHiyo8_29680 [Arthrobacter sp. Hiyo8]|nr:hypothetical protein AHiyo8_29680 [Arthrobacter sp. Hiyo8]